MVALLLLGAALNLPGRSQVSELDLPRLREVILALSFLRRNIRRRQLVEMVSSLIIRSSHVSLLLLFDDSWRLVVLR